RARLGTSRILALEAEQSYRLDGWIRCARGRARLGLDVLDGRGAVRAAFAGPWVLPGSRWEYTALERDIEPGPARARIWLECEGRAAFDDLALVPLRRNLVYNPGFDADSRGRLGMWGEETGTLLPGERAGAQKSDPTGGRDGAALLLEAAAGRWCGARVVPAVI